MKVTNLNRGQYGSISESGFGGVIMGASPKILEKMGFREKLRDWIYRCIL